MILSRRPSSRVASGTGSPLRRVGASFVLHPGKLILAGSDITTAADALGGPISLTAALTKRPVYDTSELLNGYGSVRTSNVATALSSATGGVTGAAGHTMLVVGKVLAVVTNPGIFAQFGTINTTDTHGVGVSGTTGAYGIVNFGNNVSPTLDMLAHEVDDAGEGFLETYAISYDGTTRRAYRGGKLVASAADALNIAAGSIAISSWHPSFSIPDTKIWGLVFVPAYKTPPEMVPFYRFYAALLGYDHVVYLGDSTSAGGAGGTTLAHNLPRRARYSALANGRRMVIENLAVSSTRSDQHLVVANAYVGTATKMHLLSGFNDIIFALPGGNASTGNADQDADLIYVKISAIVDRAIARGCKIVVGTLWQWNLAPGLGEDTRVALNARIRDGAGVYSVADYAAALGPYPHVPDYLQDGLHQKDSTNDDILGPLAAAACAAA